MSAKLAVFNLPPDVREREIEDLFSKYGCIERTAVRGTRDGTTMAFVEFAREGEADAAISDRHGYNFEGQRLRVEKSAPSKGKGDFKGHKGGHYDDYKGHGKGHFDKGHGHGKGRFDSRGRNDSRSRRSFDSYKGGSKGFGKSSKGSYDRFYSPGKGGKYGSYGGKDSGYKGHHDSFKGHSYGKDRYHDSYSSSKGRYDSYGKGGYMSSFKGKGKKSGKPGAANFDNLYKVKVLGIPESSSWQDLKDFFRNGDSSVFILRTDIKGRDVSGGEVYGQGGFEKQDEAERICDACDGKEFKARNGDQTQVRVELDRNSGPGILDVSDRGNPGYHSDRQHPSMGGGDSHRGGGPESHHRDRDNNQVGVPHRGRSRSRSRSRSRDRYESGQGHMDVRGDGSVRRSGSSSVRDRD